MVQLVMFNGHLFEWRFLQACCEKSEWKIATRPTVRESCGSNEML